MRPGAHRFEAVAVDEVDMDRRPNGYEVYVYLLDADGVRREQFGEARTLQAAGRLVGFLRAVGLTAEVVACGD
jgi:hypothetical protein